MKKIIISIVTILIIIGMFIIGNVIYKKELKKNYQEVQLKCDIVGNTLNYIYVNHDKKDTIYTVTNLETNKSYEFVINSKEEGGLVGLANGVYSLKRDEEEYRIVFDHNNHSYEFDYNNKNNNGSIVLLVLDKNDNPVGDKQFNIYLYNGVLAHQLKTSDKGLIVLDNIALDYQKIFYVEEANNKQAQRYYFKVAKDEVKGLKIHID